MFQARIHMIDGQLAPNQVSGERVVAAMGVTPRERFVPDAYRHAAYTDAPVPLSPHRAMLSPVILGRLLQEAPLNEHSRVLVIAGSTGYSAAILAMMGCHVVMLEDNKIWADKATALLKELNVQQVNVVHGALDGSVPTDHTFDAVLIEGAVQALPKWLFECLTPDGCVLTILRDSADATNQLSAMGHAIVAHKQGDGWHTQMICAASMPVIPAFRAMHPFTL